MPTTSTSPILFPTAAPAEVADAGKIRTGAGFKILPSAPPAEVADSGKIRTGAGFKVLAA